MTANLVALLLATMNIGTPTDFTTPRTCEQFAQVAWYQAQAAQFADLTPDAAYEETLEECGAAP